MPKCNILRKLKYVDKLKLFVFWSLANNFNLFFISLRESKQISFPNYIKFVSALLPGHWRIMLKQILGNCKRRHDSHLYILGDIGCWHALRLSYATYKIKALCVDTLLHYGLSYSACAGERAVEPRSQCLKRIKINFI